MSWLHKAVPRLSQAPGKLTYIHLLCTFQELTQLGQPGHLFPRLASHTPCRDLLSAIRRPVAMCAEARHLDGFARHLQVLRHF